MDLTGKVKESMNRLFSTPVRCIVMSSIVIRTVFFSKPMAERMNQRMENVNGSS